MKSVLICDDAAAYGTLFTVWMQALDVEHVAQARTAKESLDLAAELRPAVIVTDHLLPDGDSQVLVPQLRAVSPDSKVLLISGMTEDRLAAAAEAVQADGHLSKASSARAMQDAVARLLG